jgi:hypothetical protein
LREDGVEVFYGSEGYYFGTGEIGASGQDFGSVGDYIDVCQCKCAGCFAEEGGFLVIGFDQCQVDQRGPEFEGKGGESGAGADVEDAGRTVVSGQWSVVSTAFREEVAGQEEGLAEVAGYDFFWMADGGQVDAGVPAEQ